MKNLIFKSMLAAASVAMLSLSSCTKEEELPDSDENELITAMQLTFTNTANSADVQVGGYSDVDGTQGPAQPVITGVKLKANSTYTMVVTKVADESKTPAENTLNEIKEKASEHLFVYTPAGVNITINATDKDSKGLPVGITNTAATGAAASGTLKVQLRHQPGTKNGTASPGSDDINVDLPLTLQ